MRAVNAQVFLLQTGFFSDCAGYGDNFYSLAYVPPFGLGLEWPYRHATRDKSARLFSIRVTVRRMVIYVRKLHAIPPKEVRQHKWKMTVQVIV